MQTILNEVPDDVLYYHASRNRISKWLFSRGLFMLAREENLIDEFYEGLKMVEEVFTNTPEYLQFLATPSIPKSERTAALAAAFEGKVNAHVLSFLCVMCEQGKTEQFFDSASEFYRLREWESGTVVAVVKSVVELTESQKTDLVKALEKRTGKKVTLSCIIDDTLLGGIAVELDGQLLDGSVKSNLKRAKEVISV